MVDEQVMSTCFLVSAREKSIALLVFMLAFAGELESFAILIHKMQYFLYGDHVWRICRPIRSIAFKLIVSRNSPHIPSDAFAQG